MTVREMIDALQQYEPTLEVCLLADYGHWRVLIVEQTTAIVAPYDFGIKRVQAGSRIIEIR